MRVEGQCHCGAIAYEAEVEPGTVAICNCTDCQMQSGSGFRINIATPADKFHLLRGNPKRYLKVASSGARRIHTFCGNCGGPIYSCAAENTQSYSLRVGALKQRYELGRPVRQIWTRSRLPWIPPLDGVEEFDGQP
jgi:hypothetical protein